MSGGYRGLGMVCFFVLFQGKCSPIVGLNILGKMSYDFSLSA